MVDGSPMYMVHFLSTKRHYLLRGRGFHKNLLNDHWQNLRNLDQENICLLSISYSVYNDLASFCCRCFEISLAHDEGR